MRLPLLAAATLLGTLPLPAQSAFRTNHPAPECAKHPSPDTAVVPVALAESPPMPREVGRLRFPAERVPRDSTYIVRLRFVVNADGRADSARIETVQSPDSVLTASAHRALLASRFWPACRGGMAVRTWPIEQRFRFRRQ